MCPSRLYGRGDQKTAIFVSAKACNLEKCRVSGVCNVELRGCALPWWVLGLGWADSEMFAPDQISVYRRMRTETRKGLEQPAFYLLCRTFWLMGWGRGGDAGRSCFHLDGNPRLYPGERQGWVHSRGMNWGSQDAEALSPKQNQLFLSYTSCFSSRWTVVHPDTNCKSLCALLRM